jgi:hypothetical protein
MSMKGEWRQPRSWRKVAPDLQNLVRERLIGAGAEYKVHREHEQWRLVFHEGPSRATVTLYENGTCRTEGYAPAADFAENLVLKIIQEDEIQRRTEEPVKRPGKKQKWYAIAEPIRYVYDDYEKCLQDLVGRAGRRLGPVEVSSKEEGWAILNGGVRLHAGRYAFTDASICSTESVGIAAVIVEMHKEVGEPICRLERDPAASETVEKMDVEGVAPDEIVEAFRRLKHIFGEMLALHMAIQEVVRLPKEVPMWPKLTIVHDYLGVYAWMRAGAPQGASIEIVRGFSDAAKGTEKWRPPKDTVAKVVQACWQLAMDNHLFLAFRHQPGHRSEAAGVHHYVRFNRRADELAFEAARRQRHR